MDTDTTKTELYLNVSILLFLVSRKWYSGTCWPHTTTVYKLTQSVKNFDFAGSSMKAQIPRTQWSCIHLFLVFFLFHFPSFFFFLFFFFLLVSFLILFPLIPFFLCLSALLFHPSQSSLFLCSFFSLLSLPLLSCSLLLFLLPPYFMF